MAFTGPDVSPDKRTGLTFRGKEILLCKERGFPRRGLFKMGEQRGIFPLDKKIEAATLYAVTGDIHFASDKSKVPVSVVKSWVKEPWFRDILLEFRQENLAKLDAKFTQVIDKALEEIAERLEGGDYVVTKNGELVRKPVGIRDLALVQAINIDKRQLIRGEPTSRSESSQSKVVDDSLKKLAATFERMVGRKREPVTIEATDVMEIIEDAKQIESSSSPDGGSSALTEVRKEGGD